MSAAADTAVAIAAAVRAGERSAVDVLDAHLARIEEAESDVHAFNLVLADEARAAADAVDAGWRPVRTRVRSPACRSR